MAFIPEQPLLQLLVIINNSSTYLFFFFSVFFDYRKKKYSEMEYFLINVQFFNNRQTDTLLIPLGKLFCHSKYLQDSLQTKIYTYS